MNERKIQKKQFHINNYISWFTKMRGKVEFGCATV